MSAIKVTAQKSPAQPPANRLPVAANDTAMTPEGTAVTIPVLANDTDPDSHTLTVTSVTQAANGCTVVPAGTAVTYTPKANFHGSDTFTYTVSDGNGGTATGTVTVTVVPVNSAPVARNSTLTTAEDTVASGTFSATDADGDAFQASASLLRGARARRRSATPPLGPTPINLSRTPPAPTLLPSRSATAQ